MDILNDMDRKCDEVACHLDGVFVELEELADPEIGPEPDSRESAVPSSEIAHEEPSEFADVDDMADFDMEIEL